MEQSNGNQMNAIEEMNTSKSFKEFRESRHRNETLVILGAQGSGTNLLVKILKDVFGINPVLDRSLIFDSSVAILEQSSDADFRRHFEWVCKRLFPGPVKKRLTTKHYARIGTRFEGIEEHFEEASPSNATEFANFFYSYADYLSGSQCQAIKSDDMWLRINFLPAVLPNARFILLNRDPRDNAYSITKKNFGPCHIYGASVYIRERLDAYSKFFRAHASSEDLSVNYEDLLQSPKEFCERFSESYGLAKVGDSEECLVKTKIRGQNFNKWKQSPVREIQICEAVLREHIDRCGYELSGYDTIPLASINRMTWGMADAFSRVPQKLKRSFDSAIQRR